MAHVDSHLYESIFESALAPLKDEPLHRSRMTADKSL
jgi:hypothetical protein